MKNHQIFGKIRQESVLEAFWSGMVIVSGRPRASRGPTTAFTIGFGSFLGAHFEGSPRSGTLSKSLWKKLQMRIASKRDL